MAYQYFQKFLEVKIVSIVRYDPFRELRSLQDEMSRLFTSNLSRRDESDLMRGACSGASKAKQINTESKSEAANA